MNYNFETFLLSIKISLVIFVSSTLKDICHFLLSFDYHSETERCQTKLSGGASPCLSCEVAHVGTFPCMEYLTEAFTQEGTVHTGALVRISLMFIHQDQLLKLVSFS